MSYIDRLILACQEARKARPTRVIEVDDLSALDGVRKAIYLIEEIGGDPEKTFLEFSRYREKKERACARLNAPSKFLYVGASTTGVRKRIEQHIGDGHPGTYALHLRHWFTGEWKITVKEFDVSREVLQIIEDALADALHPAFGKKGGNNM